MKSRIFNVMQYEKHPETGEVLLTEERIKDALAHRTIKRWAYICHDQDVYSALDEEHSPEHKKGEVKPRHWHIVIEMGSNAIEIGVIAKWLGIKDNYVNVAKGSGAFLDCVQYLTHEDDKQQGLGKRLYDDEKVVANFDFRTELNKRAERKAKYGKDLSERDLIRHRVLYEGLTLRQLMRENALAYQEDYSTLDRFRDRAPLPSTRINYYVSGAGGIGKGLICRAIARSLYPDIEDDIDIFFEVGAKGAAFEGYDGQPVIIWNDRRAYDLLQELGGRGNLFNVFDTHPARGKQNIKYGSVNLCNAVNIVNSVQPFLEFLDGLAGEYTAKDGTKQEAEDKTQSYRRFPFIIPLHDEDFDLLINKGFYENSTEFQQYIEYLGIRGSMKRIAEVCGANLDLARRLEAKAITPVIDAHNSMMERIEHKTDPEEEAKILEQFADLGTVSHVVGQTPVQEIKKQDKKEEREPLDVESMTPEERFFYELSDDEIKAWFDEVEKKMGLAQRVRDFKKMEQYFEKSAKMGSDK